MEQIEVNEVEETELVDEDIELELEEVKVKQEDPAPNDLYAIVSLVLGISSSVFMFMPFFNFIFTILGILTGLRGRKNNINHGMATAGLILNIVFLLFSAVFMLLLLMFLGSQTITIFDFSIFNTGE